MEVRAAVDASRRPASCVELDAAGALVAAARAADASRRPAAYVEPDAAGAPVAAAGAAGADDADVVEPVEEGAAV